jgi:hypothetical protein
VSRSDGKSWFPAVLRGGTAVTIGGAIANDVHGENHPSQGSFCHHASQNVDTQSRREAVDEKKKPGHAPANGRQRTRWCEPGAKETGLS